MPIRHLTFAFDPAKATRNLKKHGVSFREATTVFDDPLAATFPDELIPSKKTVPSRLGYHQGKDCCLSHMSTLPTEFASSALASPMQLRDKTMKKLHNDENDALTPRPLDYSKAVRGKYYDRMQQGTNVAIIDPDLLDTFPDSVSVNEALRALKKLVIKTGKSQKTPATS